jgi:hypothetical protein
VKEYLQGPEPGQEIREQDQGLDAVRFESRIPFEGVRMSEEGGKTDEEGIVEETRQDE